MTPLDDNELHALLTAAAAGGAISAPLMRDIRKRRRRQLAHRGLTAVAAAAVVGSIIAGALARETGGVGPSPASSPLATPSLKLPSPYLLGIGGDFLRFVPLKPPSDVRLGRSAALAMVKSFKNDAGVLYSHAQLISFEYGLVTGSAAAGAADGQRVWLARYRVPFADIPLDSCPRLLFTPLPTPVLGDAAIAVNANNGKVSSWNTAHDQQCERG